MAITKYSLRNPVYAPWRDLDEVSNRLSRFFNEPAAQNTDRTWAPVVNVSETKDGESDVSLEVENNILTISGEKVEQRTEGDEDRRYHLWERHYGSFTRSFTLPRTVVADDITAKFQNGVLTVHLPKAPEAKGRKIEISNA